MSSKYFTNEKIIRTITELYIPKDELVLIGGAALQLYGIKQTRDIDAVVTIPRLFDLVADHARGKRYDSPGSNLSGYSKRVQNRIRIPVVDNDDPTREPSKSIELFAAPNNPLYQATFEELRDEADEIEGILVSPPTRILAWKQAINRPKDRADVNRIRNYLKQSPVS